MRDLSFMSFQNVGKTVWPPEMPRAPVLELYVPPSEAINSHINIKQSMCSLILSESDLNKAFKILEAGKRTLSSPHFAPCVRAEWCAQYVDVVITRETLLAMERAKSAKKEVKMAASADAWATALQSFPRCLARRRGRTCCCKACDGGVHASPLAEGGMTLQKLRFARGVLPMCAFGDTCFRFARSSEHFGRYERFILVRKDMVRVMSSAWLDSFFLSASLLLLQEEAVCESRPDIVLHCEESSSFLGSHGWSNT